MKRIKEAGIVFWEDQIKAKINHFFANDFFRNKIVAWLAIGSFVANLAQWISLWIYVQPVDFPIIMHYNVYFGVDLLGNWKQVFILPLVGIILSIINFLLAIHFYNLKERIASYLLLIATMMIQLSLLVASISVIIINY
jgi:hypothetical protein